MKYKLFEVEPEDIDEINVKECYSVGELGCCKELIKISKLSADSVCLGFGVEEGTLHGIAGSYRQWSGSAQFWAAMDKNTECCPIAFAKMCEALIQYAATKQELRRGSLTVRANYEQGNKFAKHLKFEFEGLMKRFLPDGEDANLYARIF
jgi:hypothetical protein